LKGTEESNLGGKGKGGDYPFGIRGPRLKESGAGFVKN